MHIFLKFLFFFTFFSNICFAQEGVDLNAPAPASPIQIRIPHSERSKGNLLDSTIDFLFSTFLKRYEEEDVYVSYSFFRIEEGFVLNFEDFKIDVKRKDSQGVVSFKHFKVGLPDFLAFVQKKSLVLGQITLEDIKVNLTLFKHKESNTPTENKNKEFIIFKPKEDRKLIASAKELSFKNMRIASFDLKVARQKGPQDTLFEKITARDGSFEISNPREVYKTPFAEMEEVVIPKGILRKTYFSKANTDNKTFTNMQAFLEYIKK